MGTVTGGIDKPPATKFSPLCHIFVPCCTLNSCKQIYTTVGDSRQCIKPTLSFVWSRLSPPVELSTRYTTADVVLKVNSTSATVI